jgi:phosphonate transport system substrate-binding protein
MLLVNKIILSTFFFATGALAQNAPLVIALKPDKNPEAMVTERKDLEKYFAEKAKLPVKVIVPMSGAVIQEGLINGTIDLAYLSGMEMVKAEKEKSAEILLAGEIEGVTSYESYWVSLKEKPYASVKDLRGKPVAFASRTSTSGFLIPLYDLVKKGLLPARGKSEDFFGVGNVTFGTGYVSAVERVLAGQSEAAAVSDYVMKGDKHLTPDQKAKLKVVAKQGPVPTHVLAVRRGLDKSDRAKLQSALLALDENPTLRDRLFTSKLVKVNGQKQLASLKEALKLTGILLE